MTGLLGSICARVGQRTRQFGAHADARQPNPRPTFLRPLYQSICLKSSSSRKCTPQNSPPEERGASAAMTAAAAASMCLGKARLLASAGPCQLLLLRVEGVGARSESLG
jgi:hypothetical protein